MTVVVVEFVGDVGSANTRPHAGLHKDAAGGRGRDHVAPTISQEGRDMSALECGKNEDKRS